MPLTAEPVRRELGPGFGGSNMEPVERKLAVTLVAVTRLNRNALAPFGATTRKYRGSALCLHTTAESVLFGTFAAVGLECALGHGKTALLYWT